MVPTLNVTNKIISSQALHSKRIDSNSIMSVRTRYGHTATFVPGRKMIYFLGGQEFIHDPNTMAYTSIYADFSNILMYNTEVGSWDSQTVSDFVIPTNRMFHTANLAPDSDSIIIYGGANSDNNGDHTPVTDYLYTYSIKSNTFEVVRTKKEQVGAGPRFSHTAVIVNDEVLFIMSGINTTLLATSDFYALNLKSFSWQKNDYAYGYMAYNKFENSLNIQSHKLSKREIGRGTLTIILCAVMFSVFLIVAAFIIWFTKRSKRNIKNQNTYSNIGVISAATVSGVTLVGASGGGGGGF